jgi:hypothetical protein
MVDIEDWFHRQLFTVDLIGDSKWFFALGTYICTFYEINLGLKVTKLLLYFLEVLYLNSDYNNMKIDQGYSLSMNLRILSNLCTTTTLGTNNLWPFLTGGRCSEVASCYKNWKWYPKMVAAIDKWSLLGRWSLTQVWL